MIFWGMSAYTTINIKHIGNFGVSRSPYYIELGNPEFTYLFAGLSFICMLILIFLTQYFLRSQWKNKKVSALLLILSTTAAAQATHYVLVYYALMFQIFAVITTISTFTSHINMNPEPIVQQSLYSP